MCFSGSRVAAIGANFDSDLELSNKYTPILNPNSKRTVDYDSLGKGLGSLPGCEDGTLGARVVGLLNRKPPERYNQVMRRRAATRSKKKTTWT